MIFERPGDADVISIVDMPIPRPGPGELSIDVAYCGLNFADVIARKGVAGYASRWPFVPGLEISGNVRAVGPGVEGFAIGAPVAAMTVDGFGCAEVAIAKAVLTVSADESHDQALLATVALTWVTAFALVERSGAHALSKVLVTSAGGGVGSALAAVLRRSGVEHLVGAVGSAAKGRALDHSLWDDVLVRDEKFIGSLRDRAGDSRFSTVFESVGGDVFRAALRSLAPAGHIISYGTSSGTDHSSLELDTLRRANHSVSGFSVISQARNDPSSLANVMRRILEGHWADLWISSPRVMALSEAIEAHLAQARGELSGKTVVALR